MTEIKNCTNIAFDVTDELRRHSANIRQDIILNEIESNIDKVVEQKNAFEEIKDVIEIYKDLLQQEILNIEKLSLGFDQIDKEMSSNISGI